MSRQLSWWALFLWLLLLAHCHTLHRFRRPVLIHGQEAVYLEYEKFIVYHEPDIETDRLQRSLALGWQQCQRLREHYFAGGHCDLHIVVYKDRSSYLQHASPVMRNSLARYSQRTARLSLVLDAPRDIWRHELVHALISQHRQGSYRVHEGLAFFLQNQEFAEPPDCNRRLRARMPNAKFAGLLQQIRQSPLPDMDGFYFRSNKDQRMQPEFLAWSTYYMYFLYQQGLLQECLQHFLAHPGSSFEFPITRGNREALRKHHTAFGQWLQSSAPTRAMPGC